MFLYCCLDQIPLNQNMCCWSNDGLRKPKCIHVGLMQLPSQLGQHKHPLVGQRWQTTLTQYIIAHRSNVGPTYMYQHYVGPTLICRSNVGSTSQPNVGPTCWPNVRPMSKKTIDPTLTKQSQPLYANACPTQSCYLKFTYIYS